MLTCSVPAVRDRCAPVRQRRARYDAARCGPLLQGQERAGVRDGNADTAAHVSTTTTSCFKRAETFPVVTGARHHRQHPAPLATPPLRVMAHFHIARALRLEHHVIIRLERRLLLPWDLPS